MHLNKTLIPGFFWYAIDTKLFRLGSTNPKKNSQTLDDLVMFDDVFSQIIIELLGKF